MYNRSTVAVLTLVLLASTAAAQQPTDTTRVAVKRTFAAWSAADSPGCAVGVGRDGKTIFENGYGMANLELDAPITPSSIFHVASVSKQFTAMAGPDGHGAIGAFVRHPRCIRARHAQRSALTPSRYPPPAFGHYARPLLRGLNSVTAEPRSQSD